MNLRFVSKRAGMASAIKRPIPSGNIGTPGTGGKWKSVLVFTVTVNVQIPPVLEMLIVPDVGLPVFNATGSAVMVSTLE